MGEVAAARKVEAHDAPRVQQRRVHRRRSRGAVGLHVDAPLFLVETERRERAVLAQHLDLVDVLVAAVVALPGGPRCTCCQARTQSLHHGADVKFSLAMSSMPCCGSGNERERTIGERNERETRQREEGVRCRRGRDEGLGGGVGSARGARVPPRGASRGRERAGRPGRSIGSIAVNRDGSFPPADRRLPRRSSRDAWGGEGAGAIDAGAGEDAGARDDAHLAELLLRTRAYTSGSASRGLRASGKTAFARGAGGRGGGIRGRRTTVSRDERRQPRSRAGGGDVGGGPRSRRARPRRGASIEARARRRGRFARAMTHHGVLRGRVASRGARRGSARRSRSERGAQPQGPVLFGVSSSGRSEKRAGRSWPWSVR